MAEQPISNEVALRIALASRLFPEFSIGDFVEALHAYLGDFLDEISLSRITVTNLKTALGHTYELDGEEHGEDADATDIASFKKAVRILWGELDEIDQLPAIEPYQEGDMPHSIRVAVASNNREALDGHFGSCLRYLIYQLSTEELRLIDIRSALEADLSEDKNAFRVGLIRDCPVLYIVAIGGPAAGKVVQAGIYPIKKEVGGAAREMLSELQHAIATSPPPWLAKILGIADGDRVKNYKALV
ncbi:dinitrogenase iron-molybdenum cofactor biosynthesis protein [Neosynechococcus sphagnicola sy1]|uniref:Dinitrogenase iron-molybdenum cofactor biosynthesis protein n=1 Tax=Neosynechococcus sphagnicola sy1 TaxID=1497020 RepID=A0A098TPH1_9CYAN|nr:dinitrogenase iron-molybdenum cofactor biosynthesis protein [Neosynechococcus sphagnicola]KGF73787.1 dinitrogenase iron-molybdenum cofactor biosynthesis protein [Neosynechococcus sphagnicola sy1]